MSTHVNTAVTADHQPGSVGHVVRPHVHGKFLFAGEKKLYVCGVTYGPFRPDADGCEYHDMSTVDADFSQMAACGINSVRTYTVPPRWLLDVAQKYGLSVMIGLPWEQHITFLDGRRRRRDIEQLVRKGVRACAGHPSVLGFTVGNEIPAGIVRWYGRRPIERFIERLYHAVKQEDPDSLVTYVNYPSSEYLQLPFLDLVCFNVYLESSDQLRSYLLKLHNIAGDRPLLLAEVGLDSARHGRDQQAESLEWQLRDVFAGGCAGTFVFSWTDEWHRGGFDIEDWSFGLTDRDRSPKPALSQVKRAFAEVPFSDERDWPSVSVVVCTNNGQATIRRCCDALSKLDYPKYEVIVVNDGSTDETAKILREFPDFHVVQIPNGGLSKARNAGMKAATGQIIAYTDDDAYPDVHWLKYLAETFMSSQHVAAGGPNIPPEVNEIRARSIALAPGSARHVLLTDDEAEHIPGCNMAFRKSALEAIGGFDGQFRIAGDDVDVCWRLQERDGTVGFSPGAMVWHERRRSISEYLRQQTNYGRAEPMLEAKWPDKHNTLGHVIWRGRIYQSTISMPALLQRWRIYHGVWGTGFFQSIYPQPPGLFQTLPLMPEWYLLTLALVLLCVPGFYWQVTLIVVPLLLLGIGLPIGQAIVSAARVPLRVLPRTLWRRRACLLVLALLHLLQPITRLRGRLTSGLTPWRLRTAGRIAWPKARSHGLWSERWKAPESRLADLEAALRKLEVRCSPGGEYDRWDLELKGGPFGGLRLLMAIEEHGFGRQLVRLKSWPNLSSAGITLILLFILACGMATAFESLGTGILLLITGPLILFRAVYECGSATACYLEAIKPPSESSFE